MPGRGLNAPNAIALLGALLAFASPSHAIMFDCERIRKDKISWNLSALGGPRTVSLIEPAPPVVSNTTFTIDICKPLGPDPSLGKEEQCPDGTRVCAVERTRNTVDDTDWAVQKVVAIAGIFNTGKTLEPEVERLKDSASNGDSKREGLRVTLGGGRYPDKSSGMEQKAIIEFECDASRTGLEDWEGKTVRRSADDAEDDDKDSDRDKDQDDADDSSLKVLSWNVEGDVRRARLLWRTKYACEDAKEPEPETGSGGGGMGFFGWVFLILFLGLFSYLAVGSWINYSRYGAQGWDLLPHGDTVRDLPYIFKDWLRSLMDSVQGRGSRGGYSAV